MDILTDLFGNWLMRTSLEGAALILIVLGLVKALGRHLGPRWRVFLWAVVGLKLLLPASLPIVPGFGNWSKEASSAGTEIPAAQQFEDVVLSGTPQTGVTMPAAEISSTSGASSAAWIIFLWAGGAIAFLSVALIRQKRFLSRARVRPCRDPELLAIIREVARELGLRRDFGVALAPAGTTPAVCGCFENTLLVPQDWKSAFEPGMLRPILLHELEHIRQGDLLINWLAAAVNALHWFNPLVWIAVSRFQCDRELRCDLNALSRMQPAERIGYGRALLRVQREFRPAPAIAGVAPCVRNHPSLHQRIQMIAKPTPKKRWLNAIIAPGIAGIVALSFGAATADEKKPEPPKEGEKPRDGGPREGGRPEGDKPRDGGPREGGPREEGRGREGDRPRDGGPREGGRPEGGPRGAGMPEGGIGLFIVKDGVRMGDRIVPMSGLRGEFSKLHARTAMVSAEPEIPFHQVNQVLDALRDTGIRDIRVGGPRGPRPEGGPEGGRPRPDGDRPRPEGAPRDGDRPRPEGAPRDGDRPRPEGAPRDGDRSRPEGAPRDGDGPKREGAPRDGEGPKREGAPRDGDRPKPEGQN